MNIGQLALPLPKDEDIFRYAEYPSRHPNFKLGYSISLSVWLASLCGISWFALKSPVYALLFLPLAFVLTFFYIISIRTNMHYMMFDITKHHKLVDTYSNITKMPTIDILLPVCGEPLATLRNTWEGVRDLAYPHDRMCVYVLDDSHSDTIQLLAEEFGFLYRRRANPGEMKKAGNLKFGFYQSSNEFIIILDADFRPHPLFLRHTLPYMLDNPQTAIVQTPQFFDYNDVLHQRSPLQYGAGNIQEYFYKIVQPSRNHFGAAICVGSCALYRRSALEKVGGTYQIEHSEDVWTGFSLIRAGFKLLYLPLILSKGLCPQDLNAFYKQQSRWASGSLSLGTSRYFWSAPVSWRIRVPFFSGFLYYISSIPFLLLHFAGYLVLWFHAQDLGPLSTTLALITFANAYVLLRWHIYPHARWGTCFAYIAAVWFYAYTVIRRFVFGKSEGWSPTGSRQGISSSLLWIIRWSWVYQIISIGMIVITLYRIDIRNMHQWPPIIIGCLFILLNSVFLIEAEKYKRSLAVAKTTKATYLSTLPREIRALRAEANLTRTALAQHTGLPILSIIEIEHGLRTIPAEKWHLFVQALGGSLMPLEDLLA